MKNLKICGLGLVVVFLLTSNVSAQRRHQWEFFLGGAVPLGPEEFTNSFQAGVSFHGQYVKFLAPSLGLGFGLAYEYFTGEVKEADIETDLEILELTAGIRPYLTPLEAKTQIFLFGMATLNLVHGSSIVRPAPGLVGERTIDQYGPGLALGGGVEIPAGSIFNIILQAVGRLIFLEDDTTSFLGVTAGLVF